MVAWNNKPLINKIELYRDYVNNRLEKFIFLPQDLSIDIPVLYINLNRSSDRKKFMENQFKKYQIKNFHRVEALDGRNINNKNRDYIQGWNFRNDYEDLSEAEIGCTLSHIKALILALNIPGDNFLILEDDADCSLNFLWPMRPLSKIIENAPIDWEVLQLFACERSCSKKVFEKRPAIDKNYATLAYIVNKKGIRKILKAIEYGNNDFIWIKKIGFDFPKYGSADNYIYLLADTYLYQSDLFLPSDSFLQSTIHRNHENLNIETAKGVIENYFEVNPQLSLLNLKEKQFKFGKVLKDIDKFLKDKNIKYTITDGTLLGFYREGQFIEHDEDIDLMIFEKDYKTSLENDSKKFILKRKLGSLDKGLELTFQHKKAGINVDIFVIKKDENGELWCPSFYGICDKSKYGFCRWKVPEFTRIETNFMGIKVGIPKEPEKYLVERYGINWNVPMNFGYFEGLEKDLYKGLIKDDFPSGFLKSFPKEEKISNLYPEKIKKMIKTKPILWMYWENLPGKTKPPYLNLCLETIKKYAGETFRIIILNPENIPIISRYIHKNFTNINPIGMRADYVRFCIVAEYGGIWLDVDTVLLSNLSLITNALKRYNFAAFYHEDDEDISVGIFGGNPNNKICYFYKNLFESGQYSNWMEKSVKIPWAWGDLQRNKFMKKLRQFGYDEYKTFPAAATVYPIDWTASQKYYWSKGDLTFNPDKFIAIYLHNETYTEENKSKIEKEILDGNYRISQLFRKALK